MQSVKKSKIAIFLFGVLFLSAFFFFSKSNPQEAMAGWFDYDWNYRKTITITNFPVLVSLTDSDFVGKAQDDGDDFVFTSYSGNEILKHEIESYASTTGTIVAWVKLPTISSTTDTLIQMYYGNASVSSQEQASDVWDENYMGVWHLGEATSTNRYDSSGMDNTLTDYNNVGQYSGKMGYAADFEASNSTHLKRESTDLNGLNINGTNQEITISAWIWRESDTGGNEGVAGMWEYGDNERQYLLNISDDNPIFSLSNDGDSGDGSNHDWVLGSNEATTSAWHYIVSRYDGTYLAIMHNEQLNISDYDYSIINNSKSPFGVGSYFNSGVSAQHFDGRIDEVRVSNVARSLGWTETEYNNQNSPSTFLTASTEEVGLGPVGYWSFDEGYGTTVHDGSSGGNDGAITGAIWQDKSMCVSGKCLYFDGEDGTRVQGSPEGLENLNEYTVCLWFKASSLINNDSDSVSYLFGKDKSLNFDNTGKLKFSVRTSGVYNWVYSSRNIDINKWYNVCSVYYGLDIESKIYLNGIDKSDLEQLGEGTVDDNNDRFMIGAAHNSSIYGNFHGYIDEVKVYPYARTEAQIKQDYNAGLAGVGTSKGTSVSFGSKSDSWMSDGLVGYWKMDETATTSGAIDSSGNGNDGTYYGTASTTGGKFGNGGVFSWSTSSSIRISNDDSINLGDNFSLSGWYRHQNYTYINHWIYDKDENYNITLRYGKIRFTTGSYFATDTERTDDNSWHFFTAIRDIENSEIRLYIDGVEKEASNIENSENINNSAMLHIGESEDYWNYFKGNLDELRIYNRVLSPDEARKLYEWAPGPVLHLKMDEKQGQDLFNSSFGANNGTLGFDDSITVNDPLWDRGKYGSGLLFDGTNDVVEVNYNDSLELPNSGGTISAWINMDDSVVLGQDDAMPIIRKAIHSNWAVNGGYTMALYQSGPSDPHRLRVSLGPESSVDSLIGSKTNFENSIWYYVTMWWDEDTLKSYVNGMEEVSMSRTQSI